MNEISRSESVLVCMLFDQGASSHLLLMSVQRGDLFTALRKKYFNEAKVQAEVISDWKPDEVLAVNAKTWEWVDINCLPNCVPPILSKCLKSWSLS